MLGVLKEERRRLGRERRMEIIGGGALGVPPLFIYFFKQVTPRGSMIDTRALKSQTLSTPVGVG